MDKKLLNAAIFHNLRVLHSATPQDTYIHQYFSHWQREGEKFFDIYHLAFWWGTYRAPKRIMEIGTRTGISLAQLLSPMMSYDGVRVVLFDLWSDGLATPDLVKKHLNHLGIHTNIEFWQGDSRETVPAFMEKNADLFDWILVDGDHSPEGATADLENAAKLVAPGGAIVFDDIVEFDGVVLMPTWQAFRERHLDGFTWHQDLHGKGVGWAVKI
jgi:predicted O-methyltransferase YrrM